MAAKLYIETIPKNSFHGDVSHTGFSQWDNLPRFGSVKARRTFNRFVAGFPPY
jgi:hypothetical protein